MPTPLVPERYIRCGRCARVHTIWRPERGDEISKDRYLHCGHAARWLPSDGSGVPAGASVPVLVWPELTESLARGHLDNAAG